MLLFHDSSMRVVIGSANMVRRQEPLPFILVLLINALGTL